MIDLDSEPMALFDAAVRQRVRQMSADEFAAFCAETRPPDEQGDSNA